MAIPDYPTIFKRSKTVNVYLCSKLAGIGASIELFIRNLLDNTLKQQNCLKGQLKEDRLLGIDE
jgi:hypothetical protein